MPRRLLTLMLAALGLAAHRGLAQDAKPQPPASQPAESKSRSDDKVTWVLMNTSMGDIVLKLDNQKAPITVENFVTYANDGFYDGTIFHRVMDGFMIQGGGFTPDLQQKPTRSAIKNEWTNGLSNKRGTISMARVGGDPDSATSQFFINVVDNDRLDQPQRDGAAYAVFGEVVAGMDVVDRIRAVPTHFISRAFAAVPDETITIERVRPIPADDAKQRIKEAGKAKGPTSRPGS